MFGSARGLARLARSGSAPSDRGRGTAGASSSPRAAAASLAKAMHRPHSPPRCSGQPPSPPAARRRAARQTPGENTTIQTASQPQCPAEAPPITQMKMFSLLICTELLRRRINRVPRVPSWRHRCMDPWGVAASRWMPKSSLVAALAGCVAGLATRRGCRRTAGRARARV